MNFSFQTFVIQIINFALLAYILYRVLYRPLRNIMDKRRRLVMDDVDRAIRLKEEAVKLKERYDSLMSGMDEFRKSEMEKAVKEAEETRREILDAARSDALQEKEKAAAVMESERSDMLTQLRADAAEISAGLAARLISPLADEGLHAKLVKMMAEELERNPPAQVRGGGKAGRALAASAYALGPSEKGAIDSLLREHFGAGLEIEHSVEAELIAGVRLWIDGQVLDGSLKGQLSYFRERALEAMEKDAGGI